MHNSTSFSEFLLLGFSDIKELQILDFLVFIVLYLASLTGNLLIIVAVALDHHLHNPMYFFLVNLATVDLGIISVLVPKAMANSLMNTRSISYFGCAAQVFLYSFFASSDFAFLTIMAHDRYVAICNPLQYETIMQKESCIQMAAGAWISGFLLAILNTVGTFASHFCSNVINQLFCEIPQLLKLSCSDLYLVEIGILVFNFALGIGCFSFIVLTYVKIFATVLRIPSVKSQKKAFSTCIPHLTVVSLLIFTGMFANGRPPGNTSSDLNIIFAVIYAILPPLINPFIYTMRNKEVKCALLKLFSSEHFSVITNKGIP